MKRLATIILLLGALSAIIVAVILNPRAGHPVTPLMSAAATEASGRTMAMVPGISNIRPLVVVFILPDCPCSEEYEVFTHELSAKYGTRAQFVGIVAGDRQAAAEWKDAHRTPFPVIEDPDRSIARSCAAERSAYTALINEGQTIEHLWPGYSAGMLQELGSRLAASIDISEKTLNLEGAPTALTSGCPLELE